MMMICLFCIMIAVSLCLILSTSIFVIVLLKGFLICPVSVMLQIVKIMLLFVYSQIVKIPSLPIGI